jgi:sigma-B regulation protein RsbU (phosphoserine phosphatase)
MIINIRDGSLIYSNAAHPPPVIIHRESGFQLLDKGGTIIGLDGIVPFEEEQTDLHDGDKIILYTDGVVEYQNNEEEFFTEDRFYSLLNDLRHETVEKLIDEVVTSIIDFGKGKPFQDDITLVAIEYKGKYKGG